MNNSLVHPSCKYKPITSILLIARGFSPIVARHILEHIEDKAHCPTLDWDSMATMLLSDVDALEYKEATIPFYKTFIIHYNTAWEDHKKKFREGRIDNFRETVQIIQDEYKNHCSEVFKRLYNGND